MKAEEVNIKNIIQKIISNNFFHIDGMFYINYDCIFSENQLVFPLRTYDLLDFLDGGDIRYRTVKFYHAFKKGIYLTVVILDVNTGKILHRKHRINNDNQICSWLLMETDYLMPEVDDEKVHFVTK